MRLKKPPALKRGDLIGIVAPAGPVKRDLLERGVQELSRLGYRTLLGKHVLAQDGLYAGNHAQRAADLLHLLEHPEVKAVFCARGGYGSNHVVELLSSPSRLRRLKRLAPRIIMGYSDNTTLLLFFNQTLGWTTFHGPMLTKDFASGEPAYDRKVFQGVLSGTVSGFTIKTDGVSLRKGVAEGRLTGGCMSLLTATLGTPDEIDTRGSILLLEDIDERPYRIDRMLFHLRKAGKFRGVRGVVFGEMIACGQKSSPSPYASELRAFIEEELAGRNVPVALGMRFGHTSGGCLTLPIGVHARLSVRKKVSITLLEPAVTASPESRKRKI